MENSEVTQQLKKILKENSDYCILSFRSGDTLKVKRGLNRVFSCFKGALSGLRQFLATESPLRTMENAFYFTSKALFILMIFNFLS